MQVLLLLLSTLSAHAEPNWAIHCEYVYYGAPMANIDLSVLPDGRLGPAARITMLAQGGRPHLESFSQEANGPNERAHGWLSKESPDNKIELVIYAQATPQGNSKITNHQVPFGQDVWGICKF